MLDSKEDGFVEHNFVYPGSFDPLTNGHVDIIYRSIALFGNITLAIGVNTQKIPFLPVDKRISILQKVISDNNWECNVRVTSFSGLLSEFLKKNKSKVVIRGIRDTGDFESEMCSMRFNSTIYPDIETIFLPSKDKNSFISSTLVKELITLGVDISKLVPISANLVVKEYKQ